MITKTKMRHSAISLALLALGASLIPAVSVQGQTQTLKPIRLADNFTGSDWCLLVEAADQDIGHVPGEIWIGPMTGKTTCSGGLTMANPDRIIRFVGGAQTYTINGSWRLLASTAVLGVSGYGDASAGTTLLSTYNGDLFVATDDGGNGSTNQAQGIRIEDMNIVDGLGGGRTQGAGIYIDGQNNTSQSATTFTLRRNKVYQFYDGFRLGNFLVTTMEQNRAEHNVNMGFNYFPSFSTTLTSVSNYSLYNGGVGFYYAGTHLTITSISDAAQNNGGGGVWLDNQRDGVFASTFLDLDLESNVGFGFRAINSTNFSLENCVSFSATGSPGHGIWLDSVRQAKIDGCASDGNAGNGIQISGTITPSAVTIVDFRADGIANGKSRIAADPGQTFMEQNSGEAGGDMMKFFAPDSTVMESFTNTAAGVTYENLVTPGGLFMFYQAGGGLAYQIEPLSQSVTFAHDVHVNGNLWAGATQIVSDERLKTNLTTLSDGLDRVLRLRGVTYDWNTPEERTIGKDLVLQTGQRQMGVVAQEVEKIFPEAVTIGPDGLKSVNYNSLMAPLIEAVKAQEEEIRTQQQQLAIQQHEIAALKQRTSKVHGAVTH